MNRHTSVLERLGRFEEALKELLAVLASPGADGPALERAGAACRSAMPSGPELMDLVGAARDADRETLRRRIARLADLEAIAMASAREARERVSCEMGKAGRLRAGLSNLAACGSPDARIDRLT